jgi:hypothetical protein
MTRELWDIEEGGRQCDPQQMDSISAVHEPEKGAADNRSRSSIPPARMAGGVASSSR